MTLLSWPHRTLHALTFTWIRLVCCHGNGCHGVESAIIERCSLYYGSCAANLTSFNLHGNATVRDFNVVLDNPLSCRRYLFRVDGAGMYVRCTSSHQMLL